MDALPNSHLSDTPKREPKSDAERLLLKELQTMFIVYDFTRPDRVSLSRAIIAALEAAENREREACAKIAETRAAEGEHGTWQGQEGLIIAAEIRARTKT